MGNIGRFVALSAERDRREVWRIGFHQQSIRWNIARYCPEFIGFRKCQDAGEADIAAQRKRRLGQRPRRAEAVQKERELSTAIILILKDLRDVHISIPGVDGERQPSQASGLDMGAKAVLLHIAWRPVVEVIQT